MSIDTDTIDQLFLELSQFTKATTGKELALIGALKAANDLCRSMYAIAAREGQGTNWPAFRAQLDKALAAQHEIIHAKESA